MGWNANTQKLTYPFTKIAANGQGDLQLCVGSSSLSQTTLFSNGYINEWSKIKPVPVQEPTFFPTQWDSANNKWANNATWYKCINPPDSTILSGGCGFRIASTSNILNVPSMYASAPWVYQRPRGGSYQEPFRAMDFAGYYKGAQPISEASNFSCVSMVEYQTPDPLNFTCYHDSPVDGELSWGDFDALKTKYFGVFIRTKNSQSPQTLWATNQNQLVSNGNNLSVSLDVRTLNQGTFEAFPFLSTNAIVQGSGTNPGTIYSLPFIPTLEFIVSTGVILVVATSCEYTSDAKLRVSWSIAVTNNRTSSVTLTGCYAIYRKGSHGIYDTWDSDESQTVKYFNGTSIDITGPGSVTLASGQTITYSGTTDSFGGFSGGYMAFVFGAYDSGQVIPDEPRPL